MKSIRAVERAIDVLLSVSRAHPVREVGELARVLGLSRPTIYRLLYTLQLKGLVRSYGEPLKFELGPAAGAIGDAWTAQVPILDSCKGFLDDLARETNETVALMIPISDGSTMCVHEARGGHALAFSRGVGHREKSHKGASSKVILAFGDETSLWGAAFAEERKRAERELKDIRAKGYALSVSELIPGAASVAAPIIGANGEVLASLCLFGAAVRFEGGTLDTYVRLLLAAARRSSYAMGMPAAGSPEQPRKRGGAAGRTAGTPPMARKRAKS